MSFEGAPAIFPLALLDEGHTGVALFMTLSGYLFAKLLDGKRVDYGPFFWNRLLRLAPLLLLVAVLFDGFQWASGDFRPLHWIKTMVSGLVLPTWPNGGWSITTEMHFYLLLPFLVWASLKWRWAAIATIALTISLRAALFVHFGDVQYLAYWTIIGHVDQFVLGIFAFRHRDLMRKRHVLAILVALAFMVFWYRFDVVGGFYGTIRSPVWIILSTIEAVTYGCLIAYYDTSYTPKVTGISGLIGQAGAYSYSIYLLHPFVVFQASAFIDTHIMRLSNFYVASLWAALFFAAMVPVGWLSFKYIESPFLRHRRLYVRRPAETQVGGLALADQTA